jgi:hypothetical protein
MGYGAGHAEGEPTEETQFAQGLSVTLGPGRVELRDRCDRLMGVIEDGVLELRQRGYTARFELVRVLGGGTADWTG